MKSKEGARQGAVGETGQRKGGQRPTDFTETGSERDYQRLDQRFSDSVGKSDLTEGAPRKREEKRPQVDDRVMKHWLEAYADQTFLTSI